MLKTKIGQIVTVTLGLSATGVVVGACLGTVLTFFLVARVGTFGALSEALFAGATFGAATGLVLAPLAAWTLMRHVPIWRAISETALGTTMGAAIGLALQPHYDSAWLSPVLLGLGGFGLAAVRLRLAVRPRSHSTSSAQAG